MIEDAPQQTSTVTWAIEHWPAIAAFAATGMAAIAIIFGRRIRPIRQYLERRLSQSKSDNAGGDEQVCACLRLGHGGKTTLIRNMFSDTKAVPDTRTIEYRMHQYRADVSGTQYHVKISDYQGQDLGEVTRGIVRHERDGTFRAVNFNALMVVLDLCATREGDGRPVPGSVVPDKGRFTDQANQWGGQAMQAVLGLLDATKIRYALIFVNKIDALSALEQSEFSTEMKDTCEILSQKLRALLPYASVNIRIGSAQKEGALKIRGELLTLGARAARA